MERGFYNDDFEQLVKQKADQYTMYPSHKVWKGINRSLHNRKKWYWLSFLLFLTGISYYAIVELITPGTSKKIITTATNNNKATEAAGKVKNNTHATLIPFVLPEKTVKNHITTVVAPTNNAFANGQKMAPAWLTINEAAGMDGKTVANVVAETPVFDIRTGQLKQPHKHDHALLINSNNITTGNNNNPGNAAAATTAKATIATTTEAAEEEAVDATTEALLADAVQTLEQSLTPAAEALTDAGAEEDKQRMTWQQEKAAYELKVPKARRISWQLAFSPTMNYRKLTGNSNASIQSDVKNVPIALNIAGNADNLVNHKPALGFELGTSLLYAVNKTLTLKGGFQFNYSRYDIQAYSSYTSERATIALSNFYGYVLDSLTSYTRLHNFGGDEEKNLRNEFFQLAVPVGLELHLFGNNKLQLNIGGTVQPTYLLNRDIYLITTDYKNYTREPSLVRRWNVNVSGEAFLSYKAGGLRWQVGPQFRYQLLSSYADKYPVREYLVEYGIKIGVTKTIR